MQRVFGDLDALLHVDRRLDEDRRAAFLAHLATEPGEAERVATWARQNEVIRQSLASVAAEPVPLWLRLGQVAGEQPAARDKATPLDRRPRGAPHLVEAQPAPRRAETPRPLAPVVRSRRGRSIGVSAAVLLAIGLLVIAGARTLLPQPGPAEQASRLDTEATASLVRRATEAYRTYALDPVHPVEMTAVQEVALDRWFQRRLSFPVRAPDLRVEGWTVLGGRLVPGETGPAAYYVFESGSGERLGVFIGRSTAMPTAALALDPLAGGGSVLSWVAGQTAYAVASGKSLDWLSRNAETLRMRIAASTGGT